MLITMSLDKLFLMVLYSSKNCQPSSTGILISNKIISGIESTSFIEFFNALIASFPFLNEALSEKISDFCIILFMIIFAFTALNFLIGRKKDAV